MLHGPNFAGPDKEQCLRPWFVNVERRIDDLQPAILTSTDRWSYQDLFAHAGGTQRWLDRHQIPVGQPVLALVDSLPDSFALALAAPATGRPLAPLSPRLTVAEVVTAALRLNPSAVIAHSANADLASAVGARIGAPVAIMEHIETAPWTRAIELPEDTPFLVMHTAGTSGIPKAVPKFEDGLPGGAASRGLLKLDENSIYATASPFNHMAGLGIFLMTVSTGAAIAPLPRFSVEAWVKLIDAGVTHATLVPTMWEKLMDAGQMRVGSLQVLQHGGAPMPPDLLRRAMKLLPGVDIISIYGQTEGSPITCLTPEDHRLALKGHLHLLATVGRAVSGTKIRIDDPDDSGVGEVFARGAHLVTNEADGWLHTGDLGSLTDDGYLKLAGRRGDMIIRGGENVYPIEVENVLEAHPEVREVAVAGNHDPQYGEVVVAYIVPRNLAAPPSPVELRAFARSSLAGFKVPTSWTFLPDLPRNSSGKVLRHALPNRT
jgi:acyl-CoA synthetase (AMP-forming)/AMP-acid ligase II